MKIEHNGWIVEIPDNAEAGGYVYVSREDRPGAIHIKAEDEGWVADLWPQSYVEPLSSLCGLYSDLDDLGDEGDGADTPDLPEQPIVDGDWRLVDAAGAVCHTGQVIADFRHIPAILESGTPPHEGCSSGSVQTDRGNFYPKVYHLRWTKEGA